MCLHAQKTNCPADDPFADYEGAVRCLSEGAGDVAFTKAGPAVVAFVLVHVLPSPLSVVVCLPLKV